MAGVGLVITTLLTVSDVFMRYVFNDPIFGAAEIGQVLLCILVFTGFFLIALDRNHIRVTLFESVLNRRVPILWRFGYDLFAISGSAAVAGILIWRLVDFFAFPEDTLVLQIPMVAIVSLLVLLALGAFVSACVAAFRSNGTDKSSRAVADWD